jgi:exoribonuclease R
MWIAGILELSSKVRYGITSRGLPIFRFIPYDRTLGPFAVGCSQRNLLYNVHAIVEPLEEPQREHKHLELPRATLIQLLGTPTPETETAVLLSTYAYDNTKELRKHTSQEPIEVLSKRERITGFTFHIDPPGCKDVDDTFTFLKTHNGWIITINIADVSSLIDEGSPLDLFIQKKATSFYSPTGKVLAPMIPPEYETLASLLPGKDKLTLSLQFDWDTKTPLSEITDFRWIPSITQTNTSYTYDEAQKETREEILALKHLTNSDDSHKWVETLMIFYNTCAGEKLKSMGQGILRGHTEPQQEKLEQWTSIDPNLAFLAYESAKYIHSSKESTHYGLGKKSYAYASSPIRRYCDLVNQRALKGLSPKLEITLIDHLNRRQKQAKAFSRDLFFMTELKRPDSISVTGTVISPNKVYVPAWKRVVNVKTLTELSIKTQVTLRWYDDMKTPFWKDRIIFSHTAI